MQKIEKSADILIIGGGAAGCFAAITLADKHPEMSVLLVDKANVKRSGAISMGMVDGLVWELKGFWLVGILRVIYEFVKNLILNSQMENRLKNS